MILLKKIRKSSLSRRIAALFISSYVKLVWATGKWDYKGTEHPDPYWRQNKAMIGCFWHGRLLMMFKTWRSPQKFHMLNSNHADGDILARAGQTFGFGSIRGSSTRGGAQAFRTIVKTLRGGESIGITPEGAKGPYHQVGIGVIKMARLGGVPILPVSFSSTRGRFMKSWDKFFLPFPFGRGVFIYGPVLEVAGSPHSDEELRQELEKILQDLTIQADLHCKQTVP